MELHSVSKKDTRAILSSVYGPNWKTDDDLAMDAIVHFLCAKRDEVRAWTRNIQDLEIRAVFEKDCTLVDSIAEELSLPLDKVCALVGWLRDRGRVRVVNRCMCSAACDSDDSATPQGLRTVERFTEVELAS